ncbi:carboxylic ester hydrolase [Favolaschia claudopus]|uniref:Carboxylic ester hydrolase n=1 Tax=Favolaschia claudopus TaxID=2862362 RepID=A0AAW0E729_9AGAR
MESPAHQFICIPELYELLLDQLKSDHKALARLGRAARFISRPALDALWTKLTNPSHIVRLLSVNDVIQPTPGHAVGEYTLVRPLEESDFVLFDKYAPRVLFVDFETNFTSLGSGIKFFSTIKKFRNPIFPNLLRLDWHPTTGFDTMGAFHLISREYNVPRDGLALTMWGALPSRQNAARTDPASAFLTGAGTAETIDLFQKPLSSWLPDVSSLTADTETFLAEPSAFLQGLQSLSRLQHFQARTSGSLGSPILDHLARLPHLKTLHIGYEDEGSVFHLSKSIETRQSLIGLSSFPALETLEMNADYSGLLTFLSLITSNFLRSANLRVKDYHPIDSTIFSLLTTPPTRSSTLRNLTFQTRDYPVTRADRHVLFSMAAFEPLLACRNLETLDINFDASQVDFGDDDLEKMTDAWPQLTHFKVFSRYTQEAGWADPQVHLYSLWHFVENCRQLQQLELRVYVPRRESISFSPRVNRHRMLQRS